MKFLAIVDGMWYNKIRYMRRLAGGRTENNMKIHKKTAAFIAAMAICASSMPWSTVHADNEENTVTASTEATEAETQAQDELVTSGDYKYQVLSDGKISIEDCTSADKELTVPSSIDGYTVSELGKTAFGKDYENNNFETITLPATLEYISVENPFLYCEKLIAVNIDGTCKDFASEDGILYSKDKKKLICYPMAKNGDSFTLPEGVESIGSVALYNTKLREIKFPTTLVSMGNHALSFNENIESYDFSKTKLVGIGMMAFADCKNLSEVLLPETLYEISGGAFINCKRLTDIKLPSKLEVVGQSAFTSTGLKKIIVPPSVTDIGYCAFGYYLNTAGEEVADDDFVIIGTYGSAAQAYCTDSDAEYDYQNNFTFKTEDEAEEEEELLNLEQVREGEYSYAVVNGEAVIMLCAAEDKVLTVPEKLGGLNVTAIYPAAFQSCKSEEIILPETVKLIREMAFYKCENLKKIVLPQSVQVIGNYSFDSCTALEEFNAGGAKAIGGHAFDSCPNLKKVTLSGNCTDFEPNLFVDCLTLEEINVTDGNGNYSSVDGVLFNKDKTELVVYPSSRPDKVYKMPDSVKKVQVDAFINCSAIEDIVLSKNLTELEKYAVYNCPSLKSIRAFKKLETIGDYAFGFRYNEQSADGENVDVLSEGIKLYAPKNSAAYDFAKEKGIEVISGTVRIGDKNVRIVMLGILGGAIGAAVLAVLGLLIGKKIRKKREADELSGKAEEKRRKKAEKEPKLDAGDKIVGDDSDEVEDKENEA